MNKRTLNQRLLLILIVATSFVSGLKAQDVDSLFKVARDAAFERKDYTTAIQVSKTALDIKPDYTELIIFLARVYTWSKTTIVRACTLMRLCVSSPGLKMLLPALRIWSTGQEVMKRPLMWWIMD